MVDKPETAAETGSPTILPQLKQAVQSTTSLVEKFTAPA